MENTEETKVEESKEEPKSEETPEIKQETPVQSSQVTEELLTKMVNLCEKQSETITDLTNRLNQLEEKHENLNEDYQQSRPLNIQAEVMGMYDFSKKKEVIYSNIYDQEKQRARNIMEGIKLKYPSM